MWSRALSRANSFYSQHEYRKGLGPLAVPQCLRKHSTLDLGVSWNRISTSSPHQNAQQKEVDQGGGLSLFELGIMIMPHQFLALVSPAVRGTASRQQKLPISTATLDVARWLVAQRRRARPFMGVIAGSEGVRSTMVLRAFNKTGSIEAFTGFKLDKLHTVSEASAGSGQPGEYTEEDP